MGVAVAARTRVLLVEDDAELARLYRGVLRLAGFDVQHATNGWSALRLADESPPDIVVLDIHLEGLRGDELLKELSVHPETRHIPAIVITGIDIELAVTRARHILYRPCPPDRVLSAVECYVQPAA